MNLSFLSQLLMQFMSAIQSSTTITCVLLENAMFFQFLATGVRHTVGKSDAECSEISRLKQEEHIKNPK